MRNTPRGVVLVLLPLVLLAAGCRPEERSPAGGQSAVAPATASPPPAQGVAGPVPGGAGFPGYYPRSTPEAVKRWSERMKALRAIHADETLTTQEKTDRMVEALRQELAAPLDTPGAPATGQGFSLSENSQYYHMRALGETASLADLWSRRAALSATPSDPSARTTGKLLLLAWAEAYHSRPDEAAGAAEQRQEAEEALLEILQRDPTDLFRSLAARGLRCVEARGQSVEALKAALRDPASRDVRGLSDIGVGEEFETEFMVRRAALLALTGLGVEVHPVSPHVWVPGPYPPAFQRSLDQSDALRSTLADNTLTVQQKTDWLMQALRQEIATPLDTPGVPAMGGDDGLSLSEDLQSDYMFSLGRIASLADLWRLRDALPATWRDPLAPAMRKRLLLAWATAYRNKPEEAAGAEGQRRQAEQALLKMLRRDESDFLRSRAAWAVGWVVARDRAIEPLKAALRDPASRNRRRLNPVSFGEEFKTVFLVRDAARSALRNLGVHTEDPSPGVWTPVSPSAQ